MKRSITFNDLDHSEVIALSRFYDNMKKGGAPISDDEWNAAAPSANSGIPVPENYQGASVPANIPAKEVDAFGVPYHPDLHANSRAKKENGEWRMKKGADKSAYEAWKKQHATSGGNGGVSAPQAPATPPSTPQLNQQVNPPQVPAYVPPPQEPVQAPDYGTWHQTFTQLWNSGKLTADLVNQMNAQAGVPDASHYVSNEQARGISHLFMTQLLQQAAA